MPDVEATFVCTGCGSTYSYAEDAADCCTYGCERCGERYDNEDEADDCCTYACGECGERYDNDDEARECCTYACGECGNRWYSQEEARECCRNDDEPWAADWSLENALGLVGAYDFVLYDAYRVPRLTSIEQELVEGASDILGVFRTLDFADQDTLDDYSTEGGPASVVIKSDGSLPDGSGCEIVYSRYNLYQSAEAVKVGKMLSTLRNMRGRGLVGTGRRAGTHMHLSVRSQALHTGHLGPRDVASLVGIFGHVEGVIYRLAACGWPSHRGEGDGYYYSRCLPEGMGRKTATKARRHLHGHYHGLTFDRLWQSLQRCSCSACSVGEWDECNCGAMEGATVEWRVFNSSTKPETLHAWAILAHALTARAMQGDWSELPENPASPVQLPLRNEKQQVDFILESPMHPTEREILRAALDRSPGIRYSGTPGRTPIVIG